MKENEYEKIPSYGALSISVPGCGDGWFELHEKFGKIKIEEILAPAIDYANNGFPVTELVSYYMNLSSRFYSSYPNYKETYLINGKSPKKGKFSKTHT